MKNSKKLLILVLSLVLLIGIFAVMAAAEDGASSDVLTIQYPDGTVQTYAEGEPILPPVLPKEFVWIDDDGKGYKYTVTGSAWEGIPAAVTSENLGTTVKATVAGTKGTEQVFFVVYVTGGDAIYYTNASSAGADFKNYMQNMNAAGSTTVLYADITSAGFAVIGKVDAVYRLDLNGHTLTLNSNAGAGALDIRQNEFFVYSSKEGGVLDSSAVSHLFRTNDGTYAGVRIDGDVHWGEYDDSRTDYGKNLTVYAQALNSDLYGSSVYYNGGTYIQSSNSTSNYLMMLGRTGGSSHTQRIRNCTFVVTKAGTGFLWHPASTVRTYDGCNFINLSGGAAPVFGSNGAANTLNNCSFYNTDPAYSFGGVGVKYTGTTYVAFTGAIPERPAGEFLAHVTPKTVEVAGVTYEFGSKFITDTSSAYAVNWGGVYTDYWTVGTTPYYNEASLNYIVEKDGSGVCYQNPVVDTSE
ncbi:MAG: hypothetical protein J6Q42_04335, partial [Clostridia bacterium]|nr:hypothetical protein [Clostridia bacterium]